MQEKTFHQQRVSNFGLVLITLIKYWKREKMYQNDHLFSWYSGMSFYIRCSKCGQLYSTLFSDTITFFPIIFFSFAFLYMSNNQFFSISRTCWTWFPLLMSYESDIWTQFVCVTKHIECIRFNIFFRSIFTRLLTMY